MRPLYWFIIIAPLTLGIGYFWGQAETELVTHARPDALASLPSLTGKKITLPDLIRRTTDYQILPYDEKKDSHRALREVITAAATDCQKHFTTQDTPLRSLRRINEASRHFENRLLSLIDRHPHFTCTIPKTTEGKEQRSGYPDLRIVHLPSKTIAYLDPKLYEGKSLTSSFRTFYYEPTERTSKITEDALHFLIGFAHDGQTRAWTFTHWDLIDLSQLELTLKAEFHASNADLYEQNKIIATSPQPPINIE